MAKEVRKTIGIFVNGKEVENNLKSIKAAIAKVSNELNKMTVGTDEYNAHAAKLAQLKKIYDDYKEELKDVREELEAGEKAHNNFVVRAGAIASVINTGYSALQKFVSSTQEYVEAYASIDDAMSGVMKTTGMTREEVEALNENLKNIDTRTSQEELLTIAQIGGRMGLAKDQILDFTKAVDLANVALGDSFSGGAEEISSVLGKISLAFKETRDANIGDSLTRIGSAINEVGGKANATEPNIAAFVQRVGSMPEAFRPSVQEAVALGAAFEESSIDAEVASRAFGILMNKASTDVEGFAQVMGKPVEAVRELINSNPTQFFTEFAKSLQGMDATQIGETLKGLKLNADGVVKIVGAMSGSYDRFNEILQVSNSAFSENTSLMNEFNNVNSNSAAQLEKARKRMQEARVELGEKLIPILTTLYKILGTTSGWITKNVSIMKMLIGAFAAYAAIMGPVTLKAKAMMAIEKAHNALVVAKTSIMATHKTAVLAVSVAYNTMTGATTRAAAAQRLLKTAFASTPWGVIITFITALAAGAWKLGKNVYENIKANREFNKEMLRQTDYARDLFGRLERLQKGTEEYNRAQKEILDTYPDILKDQVDELGNIKNLKKAYDQVVASIQNKIALERADAERGKITDKYLDKTIKKFEKFDKELKGMNEATKQAVNQRIEQLAKAGKNGEEILQSINNEFGTNLKKTTGNNKSNALFYIEKIVDQTKKMKNELQAVDDKYAPFMSNTVQGAQEAESELDKMNKKLRQLESQRNAAESSDDKKNIQKQIDLLKEQIRLKKEAEKTDENGSNTNTGGGHTSSSSTKYTIADFDKELAAFRKRQQDATLGEWERTKNGIIEGYDELIKKAKSLGKDDAFLTALGVERDDAVTAAGQKYLQKYTLMLTNMNQETEKLLAENGDDEVSELQKAVFGTQKQWDDKISAVKANIAVVEDIIRDMDNEDPVKQSLIKVLEGMDEDVRKLTVGKAQATASAIQKYAKDTSTFIQNESRELERSQMTELKREKAEINERYQVEIDRVAEAIEARRKLVFVGEGDAPLILQSENREEIERLMQELEKLIALRDKVLANAGKKQKSSKGLWDDLLNIDWSNFKDNWQDNLNTMADALQEFASTAFDILNSINQIQADREQAELDQFAATQDEKTAALKEQLDNGIISQKYYDAQVAKMDKEREAKEKKIQHEQFERDRKANLAKVLIEGGLAVAKAFAQYGWPAGLIPAALSTATTAAQSAMIAAQVNPYAKGGYIREEQIALMGEDGEEWVASNKLLTDRKTAPLIAALEDYQRGNSRALEALSLSQPDWNGLSQSAKNISTTFAGSNAPVVNNYNSSTDNSEVLKELKQMNAFLKDPKNRQAYISRRMQLEFDRQENEIKEMSRL